MISLSLHDKVRFMTVAAVECARVSSLAHYRWRTAKINWFHPKILPSPSKGK